MKSARNAGEEEMSSFLIPLRVVKSSLNLVNKVKSADYKTISYSSNKQPINKPGLRSIDYLKPRRN